MPGGRTAKRFANAKPATLFKDNLHVQVIATRIVRSKAARTSRITAAAQGSTCMEDDAPVPFNPDDMLPRTDISSQINSKLLANMGSANWKERNSAIEEVETILQQAGNRIEPNIGDLLPALKVIL